MMQTTRLRDLERQLIVSEKGVAEGFLDGVSDEVARRRLRDIGCTNDEIEMVLKRAGRKIENKK